MCSSDLAAAAIAANIQQQLQQQQQVAALLPSRIQSELLMQNPQNAQMLQGLSNANALQFLPLLQQQQQQQQQQQTKQLQLLIQHQQQQEEWAQMLNGYMAAVNPRAGGVNQQNMQNMAVTCPEVQAARMQQIMQPQYAVRLPNGQFQFKSQPQMDFLQQQQTNQTNLASGGDNSSSARKASSNLRNCAVVRPQQQQQPPQAPHQTPHQSMQRMVSPATLQRGMMSSVSSGTLSQQALNDYAMAFNPPLQMLDLQLVLFPYYNDSTNTQ